MISLPKIPYIHRVYMVLANPNPMVCASSLVLANIWSDFLPQSGAQTKISSYLRVQLPYKVYEGRRTQNMHLLTTYTHAHAQAITCTTAVSGYGGRSVSQPLGVHGVVRGREKGVELGVEELGHTQTCAK